MSGAAPSAAFPVWRALVMAQLREQPGRLLVTVIAIALGVALGASVYLVNAAALNEFGLATKRLVGEADVIIRGPAEGFPETLYTRMARDPAVAVASPVLELEAALPGRRETLKVLGLDPFRAAALQPALIGDIGGGIFDLFRADGVYLSSSAAQQLEVGRGATVQVLVGSTLKSLHVLGILSSTTYPQALAVMDIASAHLRLNPGTAVEPYRAGLKSVLPDGTQAVAPQVERDRAVTVTRAYRVNLNMLALVALWTGAFLVFSTQSLSVLRRLDGAWILVRRAAGHDPAARHACGGCHRLLVRAGPHRFPRRGGWAHGRRGRLELSLDALRW